MNATQTRAPASAGGPMTALPRPSRNYGAHTSVQPGDALREQEWGLRGPAAPASDQRRLAGAGRSS